MGYYDGFTMGLFVATVFWVAFAGWWIKTHYIPKP